MTFDEIEIPEEVNALSSKYKDVEIQYAWPFDMDNFASFLYIFGNPL